MAKSHKGPCARGTIHYANEAPPYGGSQLSAQHTRTHRNMSMLRSQVLSLILMLNLPSLVTATSAKPATKKKGKATRGKQDEQRGQEMEELNRGNKKKQPTLSSAPPD